MALTFDQLGNLGLTAGQKSKLSQFAAIGISKRNATRPGAGGSTNPDISGVTLGQAKDVMLFGRDLNTLMGPAIEGAQHVRQKKREDAAQAVDDASPGSGGL